MSIRGYLKYKDWKQSDTLFLECSSIKRILQPLNYCKIWTYQMEDFES